MTDYPAAILDPNDDEDASPLWTRFLARWPWPALYALSSFLAFLAYNVVAHRRRIIRHNLEIAFPGQSVAERNRLTRAYYRGFADVMVEIAKTPRLTPQDIRDRVSIRNLDLVRGPLAAGRPVLVVAAHQCNWEWMLHALALNLDFPTDAAYKPLKDPWAEKFMLQLRSRFGSRMVPASILLADVLKRMKIVRAVCMVADQEPTTSEYKHWTQFLNRDSAFFMGAEHIARATRYEALFLRMRRERRGHYVMEFVPLAAAGEKLPAGAFTERYARLVESQIHEHPADWPWSHKRWKLRRSVYAGR
jgi:Kdo2-lipid IVA lauroyltransferase/acyltransferase